MRQSVARVAIVVPGYDEGIAFYCGKLGFDLLDDSDLGGGKRWVVVRPKGAAETALLLARAEGERQRAAIGNQAGGGSASFSLPTTSAAITPPCFPQASRSSRRPAMRSTEPLPSSSIPSAIGGISSSPRDHAS